MFFVPYINLNHKDKMHPYGARLDKHHMLTKMWVRPAYLKFSKPGRCGDFCSKNPEDSRVSKQVRPQALSLLFQSVFLSREVLLVTSDHGGGKDKEEQLSKSTVAGSFVFSTKKQAWSSQHSNLFDGSFK